MLKNFYHIAAALLVLFSANACKKDQTPAPMSCNDSGFQKREVLYKGVSFVSPANPVGAESFDPIVSVNGNSVSIIPFGFVYNNDSVVLHNQSFQWWGEKDDGVIELSNLAHSKGLKVMIKPQIWLLNGQFTGNFVMDTESQWQAFESSYRDYILHFADLAESLNCDAFSIGTEFKSFVANRPVFWDNLIDSTRAHFSGNITYAENWDAFYDFPFWSQLDFIGIDAYFPLSNEQTPTVEELETGWLPHLSTISTVQSQIGIPVVFTEFGYRSVDHCGQEPWDSSTGGNVNLEAQNNAYTALFHTFWDKEWFEGGFVWKWFPDHANAGGLTNNRFTPQNKPTEQTLQLIYE